MTLAGLSWLDRRLNIGLGLTGGGDWLISWAPTAMLGEMESVGVTFKEHTK